MELPLNLRIKKKAHQEIACAQDLIMVEVYDFFPKAVLHGGTAIWRCYKGNRFSEDIDVYLPPKSKLEDLFNKLKQNGFNILKKKITENSLYSLLDFNRTQVRLESLFAVKKGTLVNYEMIDGNIMTVYSLTAEELIQEKISACLSRKKVRDLYDLFFLLRYAEKRKYTDLKRIQDVEIVDEENLKIIILSGPIPSVKEMKEFIAKWEK